MAKVKRLRRRMKISRQKGNELGEVSVRAWERENTRSEKIRNSQTECHALMK